MFDPKEGMTGLLQHIEQNAGEITRSVHVARRNSAYDSPENKRQMAQAVADRLRDLANSVENTIELIDAYAEDSTTNG